MEDLLCSEYIVNDSGGMEILLREKSVKRCEGKEEGSEGGNVCVWKVWSEFEPHISFAFNVCEIFVMSIKSMWR